MKSNYKILLAALALSAGLTSCSKKATDEGEVKVDQGRSKYVFLITSIGSGNETGTYIVPVDHVKTGTISTTGTGTETDGYSFIAQNNMVFGLVWGDQGPITPYTLSNEGKIINTKKTVNAVRAVAYGKVNNDQFVFTSSASRENPNATIMNFDAKNLILSNRASIDVTKITGIDELATFTGVCQVDNKLYLPYYTSPGISGQTTKYLDSTWVAALSYPELKFEKVIRDGRSSYSGNWFSMSSMKQIEDGDTYAWSSAYMSKNPSGFLRIKKGTSEFDKDYFFNIEALTGGLKIVRGAHITNGKFIVAIDAAKRTVNPSRGGGDPAAVKLAIADTKAKTLTYIDGTPQYELPWYDFPTYYEGDGKTAQVVVRESSQRYRVYTVDVNTAKATKGIEIVGSNVSSINKLTY